MPLVELLFVRELSLSPAALWPWVSEAAQISAWASVEITPLTPGEGGSPAGVGATRQVSMDAGPLRLHMEERITASVVGEELVYSVYRGGGMRTHQGTVSLQPTPDGTLLRWEVTLEPRLPGTGWIFRRTLARQFEADLDALAACIEADAG